MAAPVDQQHAPGYEAAYSQQTTPYIGWVPYTHYGESLNGAFWGGFMENKQEAPDYV